MQFKIKLLELFSGIGGFAKGLQQAGFEFSEHYFSEIDKHAIANYMYNYKNAIYVGDAKTIQLTDIRAIDIVCGGFPCQSFSIAGKRQGFEDARGTLFFEIVRICKDLQPKYILLENVKGLLNHDGGRTFAIIYQSLIDIGYSVEFQLVNTRWFLPQNRERVYLIGHLAGASGPRVFPIGKASEICNQRKQEKSNQIASTLNANDNKSWVGNFIKVGTFRTHKDGQGFREVKSNICPTIPARARQDGSGMPVISNKTNIRRLTEIECERLQGFPDDYTKYGNYDGKIKEIPKTQRYKMLGNAVTVNVVEAIARKLKNDLK